MDLGTPREELTGDDVRVPLEMGVHEGAVVVVRGAGRSSGFVGVGHPERDRLEEFVDPDAAGAAVATFTARAVVAMSTTPINTVANLCFRTPRNLMLNRPACMAPAPGLPEAALAPYWSDRWRSDSAGPFQRRPMAGSAPVK